MTSYRRWFVVALTVLTIVAALSVPPAVAWHAVDSDCPGFLSPDEVKRGMYGTGYTVAEGRERQSFSAEVIGVLPDALGPGRDMIVVETSGFVIENRGGLWGGMSGSPIFVDEKLLGAIAFGMAFGPSMVAGVTPASEMYKVLEYPTPVSGSVMRPARRVALTSHMRQRIAFSSGMATNEVPGSLTQLPLPVSISGVSRPGIDRISRIVDRENLPLIPFAGSAVAPSSSPSSTRVRPGDNLGAALSYGDITFAGVGTATFVCRGRVMAFGHPLLWEGDTQFGANAATSLTVIEDSFFSYELATIDEGIGTIDQDRFAGVRGVFGDMPTMIPITSSIEALNTNRSRDGRTDVMVDEMMPFLTYFHLGSNILMTMDEYSEGSADLSWTITGTDSSGDAWSFARSNLYSSEGGIADEATFELVNALNTIYFNQFEDIEFTGVDVDGSVDDVIEQYSLTDVAVSRDGVTYLDKQRVRARPGDTVYLRADLKAYSGATHTVDLSVVVPENAKTDGFLELRGGGMSSHETEICLYDPTQCADVAGQKIESFEDLLASMSAKPKNNELVAKLRMGPRARVKSQASQLLDQVVKGEAQIFVRVPGATGGAGGAGPGEAEPPPPIEDERNR